MKLQWIEFMPNGENKYQKRICGLIEVKDKPVKSKWVQGDYTDYSELDGKTIIAQVQQDRADWQKWCAVVGFNSDNRFYARGFKSFKAAKEWALATLDQKLIGLLGVDDIELI